MTATIRRPEWADTTYGPYPADGREPGIVRLTHTAWIGEEGYVLVWQEEYLHPDGTREICPPKAQTRHKLETPEETLGTAKALVLAARLQTEILEGQVSAGLLAEIEAGTDADPERTTP